jgi:hypothetical protein
MAGIMKDEIKKIEIDIMAWRNTLDHEGIWLFLTTLGCWSVPEGWLRYVAFTIAMVLFFWRISGARNDRRPFDKRISELETQVKGSLGDSDQGKALLYDLIQLRKTHLSLASFRRSGLVYFMCSVFWILSIVYYNITPH